MKKKKSSKIAEGEMASSKASGGLRLLMAAQSRAHTTARLTPNYSIE